MRVVAGLCSVQPTPLPYTSFSNGWGKSVESWEYARVAGAVMWYDVHWVKKPTNEREKEIMVGYSSTNFER